jgi:hypothetical protein
MAIGEKTNPCVTRNRKRNRRCGSRIGKTLGSGLPAENEGMGRD